MKTCITCRWFYSVRGETTAGCSKPTVVDPVTGEVTPKWHLCFTHRADGLLASYRNGTCGRRARWWEPKGKPAEAA